MPLHSSLDNKRETPSHKKQKQAPIYFTLIMAKNCKEHLHHLPFRKDTVARISQVRRGRLAAEGCAVVSGALKSEAHHTD